MTIALVERMKYSKVLFAYREESNISVLIDPIKLMPVEEVACIVERFQNMAEE